MPDADSYHLPVPRTLPEPPAPRQVLPSTLDLTTPEAKQLARSVQLDMLAQEAVRVKGQLGMAEQERLMQQQQQLMAETAGYIQDLRDQTGGLDEDLSATLTQFQNQSLQHFGRSLQSMQNVAAEEISRVVRKTERPAIPPDPPGFWQRFRGK